MDYTKLFSPEEFKALSEEEKRDTVRNFIHKIKEDSSSKAVLFNPKTHKTCSMEEMINTVGEDAIIDMLIKAIEDGLEPPKTISREQFAEIMERKRTGETTEEDEQILNMLSDSMEQSEEVMLSKNFTNVFVALLEFAQKERHFFPTVGDFLASFNILSTITGLFSDDSSLSMYKETGPSTIHEIASAMGQDILNTWLATCAEAPDDYMLLCALLEITQLVANKVKLCDSEIYRDVLKNILEDFDDEDDEDCDCEECCEECAKNENGSNKNTEPSKTVQPKIYKPSEDQEMRNMLKE